MSITISIGHESHARSRGFADLFVFFSRLTGVRIIVFGHPQRHGCFHVFFHFRWQMAGKLTSHWSILRRNGHICGSCYAVEGFHSERDLGLLFFPASRGATTAPALVVCHSRSVWKNAKKTLGLEGSLQSQATVVVDNSGIT